MSRPAAPARITGEPAWEIARLVPAQGAWSEADDLALDGNHLVEYSDGFVEVLPRPTRTHQLIVQYLYRVLREFVIAQDLGIVLVASYRIRLRSGKYREPDVMFLARERADRIGEIACDGADLVIEVVSPDDPTRDIEAKRVEYAEVGIPEYWIVDPRDGSITVLVLPPGSTTYAELGRFMRGERATSRLLPGLSVDVAEVMAARP